MRPLVLALALCCVATSAHAQTASLLEPSQTSRLEEAHRLSEEHHDGIVLRNAGIALALVGTALTIVGSYELFNGALCDLCGADTFSTGVGVLAVGQGAAIAGIAMWAGGGVRAARAERAQIAASAGGLKVTF